jgi:hypothetical protein
MSSFLLNYKKGLTGIPQTQGNEVTDYFAKNAPPTPATTPFVQGMIMLYDKTNSYPTGWFLCDGAVHNGYTTPTLRDVFVMSVGTANPTVGLGGGAASVALTLNMIPDHTHNTNGSANAQNAATATNSGFSTCNPYGASTGISNAGYVPGTPVPTIPPFVTYAYICYCGVAP